MTLALRLNVAELELFLQQRKPARLLIQIQTIFWFLREDRQIYFNDFFTFISMIL